MATSTNLPIRRSTRNSGKSRSTSAAVSSYPDGPPMDDFESTVARLNTESFPYVRYAKVDDILVYSLFSAKKHLNYNRRLQPSLALLDSVGSPGSSSQSSEAIVSSTPQFTNEDAKMLHRIYSESPAHPDRGKFEQDAVREVSKSIVSSMPRIFEGSDLPIVEHLLSRYSILLGEASPVRIEKVSFDGKSISGGLKAIRQIPAASAILSCSGSISSDALPDDMTSISAIHSPDKRFPGKRLILGPFRFINHDCEPNCQFQFIKGSSAFTIWTLREIKEKESISVSYGKNRSYFADALTCFCRTCTNKPIQLTPRERPLANAYPMEEGGSQQGYKRSRRSGKRERARKKAKARLAAECGGKSEAEMKSDVETSGEAS